MVWSLIPKFTKLAPSLMSVKDKLGGRGWGGVGWGGGYDGRWSRGNPLHGRLSPTH